MTHAPVTVREARKRRRRPLTQVELAERVEVDQTYISLIERGLRTPSDDLKGRLAKALKVAPSRLRFQAPQPLRSLDRRSDRAGHDHGAAR